LDSIKRFSQLKFRNIQSNIYDEIEEAMKSINIPKFVDLQISGNFSRQILLPLLNHIREKAGEDDEKNIHLMVKAELNFLLENLIN
jgi:hypothetical protein